MSTRSQSNAGSRRAFQDVSNNNRVGANNAKGNTSKPLVVKRTNGVKTRSMSIETSKVTVNAQARSNAFGNIKRTEEESVVPRPLVNSTTIQADPNSYQVTGTVDDIDERDRDDPLCVTEYVEDMYTHFRAKEQETSVQPTYMDNQPHINERMRSILVDWLVEVHLKFKLVPETLYLTVNLIDRFLARAEVSRPKLQLVGVTSLLLSSKYEEIYPPELRDLVYICDRAYTREDIIDMEEKILKTLEYQITFPSAHAFLVRVLKAGHADKKIVQLSCYILDGTLQSYNLLHYSPSRLAAAAVYLARRTVGRNGWSPTLLKYAFYCEEEIIPVAKAILSEKNSANPELKAVNKKYTSHRYGGVASVTIPDDF